MHFILLHQTHCEDIAVFVFHPCEKLCSIFSKLQGMPQPGDRALIKRRFMVPSVTFSQDTEREPFNKRSLRIIPLIPSSQNRFESCLIMR